MADPSKFKYSCPKCSTTKYRLSELRGSSGGISAWLDADLAVFTAKSCTNCGITEFYDVPLKEFMNKHAIKDSGNKPFG